MSTSVNQAVFARWNAAGLNSSVAALFPGKDDDYPGNPEIGDSAVLPRAEYQLDEDMTESTSKGSIVKHTPLLLVTWSKTEEDAETFQDLIEAQFNNADAAATNPMSMNVANGKILGCMLDGGGRIRKVDDNLWRMSTGFTIRWSKPNGVPS